MWKSFKTFENNKDYVFVIDDFNVITIQKDFSRQYLENVNSYISIILGKDGMSTTLKEEDFDILKLKSLIKAKELGWDIKSIEV